MNKKYKNLITAIFLILIGFVGGVFIKYLPQNVFSLVFLMGLSACKFGGVIMFVVAVVKLFTKEKREELSDVHLTIKRNHLFMGSFVFLVFGIVFCSSTFLLPYLCNKSDTICPVTSVGISFLFFIPLGIVFIVIGVQKLFKFIKNK